MESDTSQERIGEFLVKIGVMTPEQRDEILDLQKEEPNRIFGELAIERGYISDAAIDTYLDHRKG